jgi:hypothetical protein
MSRIWLLLPCKTITAAQEGSWLLLDAVCNVLALVMTSRGTASYVMRQTVGRRLDDAGRKRQKCKHFVLDKRQEPSQAVQVAQWKKVGAGISGTRTDLRMVACYATVGGTKLAGSRQNNRHLLYWQTHNAQLALYTKAREEIRVYRYGGMWWFRGVSRQPTRI